MKWILASSSPRRRELLTQLGLDFDVVTPNVDETPRLDEAPEALVRRLAVLKAVTVGERYPLFAVLGSDTVVALGRTILGKPRDEDHARAMLQMLSGTRHQVYTGVAIWQGCKGRGYVRVSVAHVTFRHLLALEIDAYITTGEPLDKAGAYAIQGTAGQWVESYEGNLETVIGLPRDVVERLMGRIDGELKHGV